MIPSILTSRNGFSFAESFAQLSQISAGPNFELQFNTAQNAALERLNAKIDEINKEEFGRGKSALLRIKASRLEREKAEIEPFQANAKTNQASLKNAVTQLTELRALADSSSVTEFDAKLAQVQETLATLKTAQRFRFGAPDGLRDAKTNSESALAGITHNNFASQTDIDNAQATIDTVTAQLNASLSIVDVNVGLANGLFKSVDSSLDTANLKIEDLESAERTRQIEEIKKLEEETSRILTNISLSFEVAQDFTKFINSSAILPQEVEPGSVLNLFT